MNEPAEWIIWINEMHDTKWMKWMNKWDDGIRWVKELNE